MFDSVLNTPLELLTIFAKNSREYLTIFAKGLEAATKGVLSENVFLEI